MFVYVISVFGFVGLRPIIDLHARNATRGSGCIGAGSHARPRRRMSIDAAPGLGRATAGPGPRRRADRLDPHRAPQLQPARGARHQHGPRLQAHEAALVRINQATQAVEPWLAEGWTAADGGTRVTMTLKRGLVFSDGQPFTADDVVFAFQVVYDERSGSSAGRFTEGRRKEAAGRGARPAHGGDHLPGAVCARPAHPGEPADPSAPSARGGARCGHLHEGVGARHAAGGSRRARSIRAAPVRAGPASRLRAQPALLRPGGRRHGAAVPGSARPRRHSRSERGAAAPGVGAARHDDERDLTGCVRAVEACGRPGPGEAARSRRLAQCRRLVVQPEAGSVRGRRARRLAAARRAAPRDFDGRQSEGVRRHRVSRRGRAGVRRGDAGEQEMVLGRHPRDSARPRGRHARAGVDRAQRPQRRRHAGGRAEPAGTLHAADAAGPAEPRAGGGGHPRRAEEDRRRPWTS